jgi:hypothetical protein
MQDIVKLVSERTGISESQALTAVETVVGFLKERLPAPVAGQIDGLLVAHGGAISQQIEGLVPGGLGGLGGLFGDKQDR